MWGIATFEIVITLAMTREPDVEVVKKLVIRAADVKR
jgi:hypothetical protein